MKIKLVTALLFWVSCLSLAAERTVEESADVSTNIRYLYGEQSQFLAVGVGIDSTDQGFLGTWETSIDWRQGLSVVDTRDLPVLDEPLSDFDLLQLRTGFRFSVRGVDELPMAMNLAAFVYIESLGFNDFFNAGFGSELDMGAVMFDRFTLRLGTSLRPGMMNVRSFGDPLFTELDVFLVADLKILNNLYLTSDFRTSLWFSGDHFDVTQIGNRQVVGLEWSF